MGSDTIAMAATVYVGLAVSSHVNGTLAQAQIDNVTVVQQAPPSNTPPTVALTSPANGTSVTAPDFPA